MVMYLNLFETRSRRGLPGGCIVILRYPLS